MINILDILSTLADDRGFILFTTIALGHGHDLNTFIMIKYMIYYYSKGPHSINS
jgi:hypothetical protein